MYKLGIPRVLWGYRLLLFGKTSSCIGLKIGLMSFARWSELWGLPEGNTHSGLGNQCVRYSLKFSQISIHQWFFLPVYDAFRYLLMSKRSQSCYSTVYVLDLKFLLCQMLVLTNTWVLFLMGSFNKIHLSFTLLPKWNLSLIICLFVSILETILVINRCETWRIHI